MLGGLGVGYRDKARLEHSLRQVTKRNFECQPAFATISKLLQKILPLRLCCLAKTLDIAFHRSAIGYLGLAHDKVSVHAEFIHDMSAQGPSTEYG